MCRNLVEINVGIRQNARVHLAGDPAAKLLSKDEARWSATKGGEVDAYGSNCKVKLTARHRLKPSSNAKSHEGSITAWLRSSGRGGPRSAQNEAR